jgi:hypothetical protein
MKRAGVQNQDQADLDRRAREPVMEDQLDQLGLEGLDGLDARSVHKE